jgi:nickel-dependent lactate racemase
MEATIILANEEYMKKINKIQKWVRYCVEFAFDYKIQKCLKSKAFQFSTQNEDGRIVVWMELTFGNKNQKLECGMIIFGNFFAFFPPNFKLYITV